MAGTRKARVPMAEQIKLINECRQSGMTDADWCRENDIVVSTFYNWVSRCRKAAADQIPPPNYGHLEVPRPKHEYYGAAEPPVRCGVSHLSGLTEPPAYSYSA